MNRLVDYDNDDDDDNRNGQQQVTERTLLMLLAANSLRSFHSPIGQTRLWKWREKRSLLFYSCYWRYQTGRRTTAVLQKFWLPNSDWACSLRVGSAFDSPDSLTGFWLLAIARFSLSLRHNPSKWSWIDWCIKRRRRRQRVRQRKRNEKKKRITRGRTKEEEDGKTGVQLPAAAYLQYNILHPPRSSRLPLFVLTVYLLYPARFYYYFSPSSRIGPKVYQITFEHDAAEIHRHFPTSESLFFLSSVK